MSLILRDYQEEAISKVMASWQEHAERLDKHLADVRFGLSPEPFVPGRELLVLATGAGKTVIFCDIARQLAAHGVLTLVLAHRDELLNQAAEKYREADPTAIVGKVAGSVNELGGTVTVASVATARNAKRLKQLQQFNFGLIVVDEGHHLAAAGYQTVLKAFPNAFVLIVTATPDRLDGKPIIDKEPLYTRGIVDLVKEKY
ncbi:MAG TPA: DEAD/DEAH box helicase family protein, partial [Ktedonobacteraceae bacterium]